MKQENLRIGCSGFYNRQWKGIFYPEKLPQSKWFSFYAEQFNTLEINATFYRFPTAEQLQVWYQKSPEKFIFSVKAPKLITHYKKFKECKRLLNDFYIACENGLQQKLGCLLFQLPPSIEYSEKKLELITDQLHPGFKNIIEFRHKSWWSKKVYDALTKKKIIFCSVSHPKLPETIITNTRTLYLRLHGKEQMFYSSYAAEKLIELEQSISKKAKINEAYIYFNNTASHAGVLNAKQLQSLMKEL